MLGVTEAPVTSCSRDCVCVTVTTHPATSRRPSRASFSRTEAITVLSVASISDLRCVPSRMSRLSSAEIMKCSTSRHWLYTAGFVRHCCLVSLEVELYECKTPKASLVSNFATTVNNLWPLKQKPPASPIINVGV